MLYIQQSNIKKLIDTISSKVQILLDEQYLVKDYLRLAKRHNLSYFAIKRDITHKLILYYLDINNIKLDKHLLLDKDYNLHSFHFYISKFLIPSIQNQSLNDLYKQLLTDISFRLELEISYLEF